MIRFLFICSMLSGCLVYSCYAQNMQNVTLVNRQFSWLLGTWQSQHEGVQLVESWKKENDSVYIGISFGIAGDDTVFSESMILREEKEGLFYIPTVQNQNDGHAVRFYLLSTDDSCSVFTNPAHDFPQRIVYCRVGTDTLLAYIDGTKNGVYKKEEFLMHRATR